jgi:hypothetical protein
MKWKRGFQIAPDSNLSTHRSIDIAQPQLEALAMLTEGNKFAPGAGRKVFVGC